MTLEILGIGTAAPEQRILQRDAAELAAAFTEAEHGDDRVLAAIHRQTRIRSRGSVLLDDPGSSRESGSTADHCRSTRHDVPGGDHGFEMTLSAAVPGTIGRHLPATITAGLDAAGLAIFGRDA